jgi:hypothetical protein
MKQKAMGKGGILSGYLPSILERAFAAENYLNQDYRALNLGDGTRAVGRSCSTPVYVSQLATTHSYVPASSEAFRYSPKIELHCLFIHTLHCCLRLFSEQNMRRGNN